MKDKKVVKGFPKKNLGHFHCIKMYQKIIKAALILMRNMHMFPCPVFPRKFLQKFCMGSLLPENKINQWHFRKLQSRAKFLIKTFCEKQTLVLNEFQAPLHST